VGDADEAALQAATRLQPALVSAVGERDTSCLTGALEGGGCV
jgi:hypothetical protein